MTKKKETPIQTISLGWNSRKLTDVLRNDFVDRVHADLFEKRYQDLLKETQALGEEIYLSCWEGEANLKLAQQLPKSFWLMASYATVNFQAKVGNRHIGKDITVSFDNKAVSATGRYNNTSFDDCETRIVPKNFSNYGNNIDGKTFCKNKKFVAMGQKWAQYVQDESSVINKIKEIISAVNTENQLLVTWPESHKYMTPPNVVMSIVPSISALNSLLKKMETK